MNRERNQESNKRSEGISPAFVIIVAAVSVFTIVAGFGVIKWYIEKSTEKVPDEIRLASLDGSGNDIHKISQNEVRLFFTTSGKYLTPFVIDLSEKLTDPIKARFIVRKLLEGPEADYLENPIPMGTKLRGFYMNRNIAVLDFSGEISNNLVGGLSAEQLCIYSVVNSIILNCESIEAVQILIDGKKTDTLRGNFDISVPIVEDVSLIRW